MSGNWQTVTCLHGLTTTSYTSKGSHSSEWFFYAMLSHLANHNPLLGI